MVEEFLKVVESKDDFQKLMRNSEFLERLKELSAEDWEVDSELIREKSEEYKCSTLWKKIEKNINNARKSRETFYRYTVKIDDKNYSFDMGDWQVTNQGVKKDVRGFEYVAAKKPIVILNRYENIENDSEKLEIAFMKAKGNEWKKVKVDSDITSNTIEMKNLNKWGLYVSQENIKNLSNYLADFMALNAESIPEVKYTDKLGWLGYNFKEILPFTNSDITCEADGELKRIKEAFHSEGTYEEWMRLAKIGRKNEKVRLYTDASFASPLLKILGTNGFITHFYGDRGRGKSVSLLLAMSIWGNPQDLFFGLNSTKFALECRAYFLQNLPLSGDELQKMDLNEMNNDDLIYMVANGKGRNRGNKEQKLNDQLSWHLVMLTTGEMPMVSTSSKSGGIARCIEIENTQEMYEGVDFMAYVNDLNENYGFAGKKYMDHIIKLGKTEIMGRYERILKEFSVYSKQKNLDTKQTNAMCVIKLADELVNECIFEEEPLDDEVYLQYIKTNDEVDIAVRALELLKTQVVRDQNTLVFVGNEENEYFGGEEINMDAKRKIKINGKLNLKTRDVFLSPVYINEVLGTKKWTFEMVKKKWAENGAIQKYGERYDNPCPNKGGVVLGRLVKFPNFILEEEIDERIEAEEAPF